MADELERRFADILADDPERMNRTGPWPGLAELLLTAAPPPPSPLTGSVPATDREAVSAASPAGAVAWPAVAIQRGLDWCTLADAWPQPRLYASVRGGHTDAPHVHQDLTSMMVVAGRERLLENVNETEYSDSTFSPRRFELYETSAGSKNMLFVNGLGYPREGRLVTTRVAGQGWEGVLLDGTAAQKVGADVVFCGRAVLLLDRQALLVLDRVVLAQPGYAEVRWHSFARVQSRVATAAVVGKAETLHMAFAANWPAGLSRSSGLPTQPGRMPDTVLRWMARHRHTDILLATLIAPRRPLRLAVAPDGGWIAARGPGFAVRLHTSGSGLNLGDA
ncbi:MAG: hypothetical protein BWZ02_03250 [Lentisphaerae bacterium ADurb.BinA184]|nr:MAG: hypothetical protein BWZ02_03250 [Lentisphaerae bacterium ADurb.BinA184]